MNLVLFYTAIYIKKKFYAIKLFYKLLKRLCNVSALSIDMLYVYISVTVSMMLIKLSLFNKECNQSGERSKKSRLKGTTFPNISLLQDTYADY